MKKVATAKEMKQIDTLATNSYGIEGLELMETAGTGIVKALQRRFYDFSSKQVLIFCGKGNNGGDGLVVARLLFNIKTHVTVIHRFLITRALLIIQRLFSKFSILFWFCLSSFI